MKAAILRNSFLFLIVLLVACGQSTQQHEQEESSSKLPEPGSYGIEFSAEETVPASELAGEFTNGNDTIITIISGHIVSSCKHSGCWMDLDMGNGQLVHVTFNDDSFTIPLDAEGKNAVALGMAVREIIPVETLRNYAREEGKSEEEVAMITEPTYEYDFIARGVILTD
jgi:hypothetical protein